MGEPAVDTGEKRGNARPVSLRSPWVADQAEPFCRVECRAAYCFFCFLRAWSTSSTAGSEMVSTFLSSANRSIRSGPLKTAAMAGGSPTPDRRLNPNVMIHFSVGLSCTLNRHFRAAPSAAGRSLSDPEIALALITLPEALMATSTWTSPLARPPDGSRGYPGAAASIT
jgi:hypothetical protein